MKSNKKTIKLNIYCHSHFDSSCREEIIKVNEYLTNLN